MDDDQDLCLCFHVSKRKVVNYLRIEKPQVASQLSDCHGAGTGCGWCIPYLEKLHQESIADNLEHCQLPTESEYAAKRQEYLQKKKANKQSEKTNLDS